MLYARIAVTAVFAVTLGTSAFAQNFATVNLSYVAENSKAGKVAHMRIDVARKAKELEASKMALELQGQQGDLQRKSRLAFDRFREDAQAELQDMQTAFEADFKLKLEPILDQISKEKGLHFVFGLEQATMIVWANPQLDISEEVVKRLDAVEK